MTTFHERLADAVAAKLGGNWAELARRSKLPASTIQQIKGGSHPRGPTLVAIAGALDLSADYLLRGVPNVPHPLQATPAATLPRLPEVQPGERAALNLGVLRHMGRRLRRRLDQGQIDHADVGAIVVLWELMMEEFEGLLAERHAIARVAKRDNLILAEELEELRALRSRVKELERHLNPR